jgi:hypothetical protein
MPGHDPGTSGALYTGYIDSIYPVLSRCAASRVDQVARMSVGVAPSRSDAPWRAGSTATATRAHREVAGGVPLHRGGSRVRRRPSGAVEHHHEGEQRRARCSPPVCVRCAAGAAVRVPSLSGAWQAMAIIAASTFAACLFGRLGTDVRLITAWSSNVDFSSPSAVRPVDRHPVGARIHRLPSLIRG